MQLENVAQNLTKHTFTIKDAVIAAYEDGFGKPVLLLHGAPDTYEMWLPLMAHLRCRYRSIAIDLPGFGQSTLPDDFDLSLDNMADFIRDLIEALEINEPVALVTTDFGGHYGLAFAVKYPNHLRGIAISNTNFFSDYRWHPFARIYRVPILGELLLFLAGNSKAMMYKSLKTYAPQLPDSYIDSSHATGFGSPSVRKTLLRMYRARDSKDFVGWEEQLITLLEQKPAIVLWGDQDPFISPDYGDRFGKAEVHHFKEYSHWLPLEAPDHYAAKLLPWLDGLS